MIGRAKSMIGQDLNHAALGDGALGSSPYHAREFRFQQLQTPDSFAHLLKTGRGDGVDFRATWLGIGRQAKQFANGVEAEPWGSGMVDEAQPVHYTVVIDLLVAHGADRRRDQADALVVTDGLDRTTGPFGGVSDALGHRHRFSPLNL